jgi:hypothetical protein
VLNLPPREKDGYAAMLQTLHGRPIATGYTARISRRRLSSFLSLRRLFDKGGEEFWQQVRANGFTNVIVSPRAITSPYTPSMKPLGPAPSGITMIDLRRQRSRPDADCSIVSEAIPMLTSRIDFGSSNAAPYLCYGWDEPEGGARWSVRGEAAVRFRSLRTDFRFLRMRVAAFVVPGRLDEQRVRIELNGRTLGSEIIRDTDVHEITYMLEPGTLEDTNTLIFQVPDAESSLALHKGSDRRTRALRVQWVQFERTR